VFIEDYDMTIARSLVWGVDVWINTPTKLYEASGTSGMKVPPNGGINMSVLDGWWPEACEHGRNGWAIGSGDDGVVDQDAHDLQALLATLEGDVLPAYADRERWVRMMEASIEMASARFSSDRMVEEYFAQLYAS